MAQNDVALMFYMHLKEIYLSIYDEIFYSSQLMLLWSHRFYDFILLTTDRRMLGVYVIIYFYFMYVSVCLHVYWSIHYSHIWCPRRPEDLDPLRLELYIVVSGHVDGKN